MTWADEEVCQSCAECTGVRWMPGQWAALTAHRQRWHPDLEMPAYLSAVTGRRWTFEDLTEDERRTLAMQARYRSNEFYDLRYWQDLSPEEREARAERWREIADALHSDPWGNAQPLWDGTTP